MRKRHRCTLIGESIQQVFGKPEKCNSSPASSHAGEVMPSFDQLPDKPQSFGYKVSWFAVKASDPAVVIEALELAEATPANWESGLAAAYARRNSRTSDPWVFVSPPVSGWVLVVSLSLPYPVSVEAQYSHDIGMKFDLLFSRLMKRFDDVQFFGVTPKHPPDFHVSKGFWQAGQRNECESDRERMGIVSRRDGGLRPFPA